MTESSDLEALFGPELSKSLDLKFQDLSPDKPHYRCTFCTEQAVYVLEKVLLQVTSGRDLYTMESHAKGHAIVCCMRDKNSENDEYVAGACHMEIMQSTGQDFELLEFDVYWKMI